MMIFPKTPALTALAAMTLLAACGGGGGTKILGPGQTTTTPPGQVEPLFGSQADAISDIGGVIQLSQSNEIGTLRAQLDNQTANLGSFTVPGVSVGNLDDDQSIEGWSDGNGNAISDSPASNINYTFMSLFNFTSTDTPGASGPVILGVLTPSGGFPTNGSIVFSGEAFVDGATVNVDGEVPFAARGVSTVTANLGATDTVFVEISGLQNTTAFDRIEITGLSLNTGTAAFDGGTVTLFDGTTDITNAILGAGHTTDAAGAFFGLDQISEDGEPDEVGGIFVGDGANGTLSGGFLAD